jgi:hypothetical protein
MVLRDAVMRDVVLRDMEKRNYCLETSVAS